MIIERPQEYIELAAIYLKGGAWLDPLMLSFDSVAKKKLNGNKLSQSEIEFIIIGYTAGTISDDEMTIWLKAVFDHGMNHEETLNYTQSMLNSGALVIGSIFTFLHLSMLILFNDWYKNVDLNQRK